VAEISTKPYLIRALYEWCADAGFTPQLLVAVDGRTRVPPGFVKDGQIVLNISAGATRGLFKPLSRICSECVKSAKASGNEGKA